MWLIIGSVMALIASAVYTYLDRNPNVPTYAVPLWVMGIALAILWGFRDWWRSRRIDRFDIGCAISLYALALFLRVGFDLRGLPGFVDNDELFRIQESLKLAQGKYSVLGIFWIGVSVFELLPEAMMFKIMDPSILAGRIGMAIFGALSVVAVYDLGRSLANRRVGLASAFLVAVAHESIHWARVGLPFILVSTFAAIMMAFAVRAARGGSHLSWAGASLALGFGMMSYQAGYFFPLLLFASSLPLFLGTSKVTHRAQALWSYTFICFLGGLIAISPFKKRNINRLLSF